ncbi:hypothetical protein CK203_108127 [Vitis vinifera]|uniref:Uncharacterized protein n=1 Tax=Vitis vinifera TaxID=29760 RepID=A0A438DK44_VITVI|nr:hypothetical protein CK203_108127 [Vitis vinifera]
MKNSRGQKLLDTFGALSGVHFMHNIFRFESRKLGIQRFKRQTRSEDVSSENEWLDFLSLGAKDFLELPTLGKLLDSKETSISYLLELERKSKVNDHLECGGRLVKRETPHNKELELSLNIMEATPEDQHSHHAKENEKFYECWERYMEAINACPHHGFDTWLLVSYFYDGMSSSMKQLLETMCGRDFMSKNPEEAMDFLSYVAEVSRDGMNRTKKKWGK